MKKHRITARWFAVLLTAGMIVIGGMAPAQADSGWNGTRTPDHGHNTPIVALDTGWNGT
jgi:hypothetical protein